MTFPVLVSTTRGQSSATGVNHAVALPAAVNNGDLLVARVFSLAEFFWDTSTAGFWATLNEVVSGGLRLKTVYKFADGAEDGVILTCVSATNTRAVWHIDRFSGASAIEAAAGAGGSGGSLPNSPLLNPSWPAEDTYWITCGGSNHGGVNPLAPTNYSNKLLDQTGTATAPQATLFSAYRQLNADSDDPPSWGSVTTAAWIANTYAVRAVQLQTLTPPRTDLGVTFYAPTTQAVVAPPRFGVGVQFFAPRVAAEQRLTPPRFDVGATFFSPAIGSGILPARFDVGLTFFPPTIVMPGTLQPPRLSVGVGFFPLLVDGGARVVPQFTSLSFGPFPGAFGDAALYKTPPPGTTLSFEERWHRRGPLGYTDFKPFAASTYEFDSAYVQLHLELDEPVVPIIAINLAIMHIDVPDQRDSGEADIPVGGAFILFNRPFNVPPDVVAQVITAIGVTEAPKVTVRTDITTTQFFAICHLGNDTTTSVAARIKWVAQGY